MCYMHGSRRRERWFAWLAGNAGRVICRFCGLTGAVHVPPGGLFNLRTDPFDRAGGHHGVPPSGRRRLWSTSNICARIGVIRVLGDHRRGRSGARRGKCGGRTEQDRDACRAGAGAAPDGNVAALKALHAAGFDWESPALFSWTGVAPYLTAQAIESTLRTIARAAAGSQVVLSYRAEDSVLDDIGQEFIRIYVPLAASLGEPVQPGWPVTEIERLVSRCGLSIVDHPARADLEQRYFAGRADGLRPYTAETLLTAGVG